MTDDNVYFERDGLLVPASVRRDELEAKAPGLLKVLQEMREAPIGLDIRLSTWEAYLLFCSLQLTVTHPKLGDALKDDMTMLARQLQVLVEQMYPEIADMIEAGWHRQLDAEEGDSRHGG